MGSQGGQRLAAAAACACVAVMGVIGVRTRAGDERATARGRGAATGRPIEAAAGNGTTAERMGLAADTASGASSVAQAAQLLDWETPRGWEELAPTALRIANLLTPGGAACSLTVLAGDGGGLAANVDRWRSQMSLSALAPEELGALPEAVFFDRGATLLELEGTWIGMDRGSRAQDWSLVGLLLVDPAGSAFLKLVGPTDTVRRERTAFLELARSFRPARTPTCERPREDKAPPGAPSARLETAAGLSLRVPAAWSRVPARAPRALELRIDGAGEVEVSLTVLAGEAGGVRANLDRWRGQVGLSALTDAEFTALPVLTLLGAPAPVLDATGAAARVLGVALVATDRSVFLRMTGPPALLEQHHEEFLELCRTLREP